MKILIDTQVFVWLVTEDSRLGQEAFRLLSDTSNRVFLSYFSIFEMVIKSSIGKMSIDLSIIDKLPEMGIEMLNPDTDALRSYKVYNPKNKDPFDNMLISVAHVERCAFMTSDNRILGIQHKGLKLIDANK